MGRKIKAWLIAAALLMIIGLVPCVLILAANGWDFSKLDSVKYDTKTYEINEKFGSISIKTDTSDIVFLPSEDEKCKVVCYEEEKVKHSVSLEGGVLTVNSVDTRKWYDYIGIYSKSTKITVYLPEDNYSSLVIKESTGDIDIPNNFKFESIDVSLDTGDVKCYASASGAIKITATTGDVSVANISAALLELSVSTGKVKVSGVTCEGDIKIDASTGKSNLSDIVCKSFISSASTGDIFLKNVIAKEKLYIERSTGDVEFEACDAAEIYVRTSTGDVEGSLLTDKVFITETSTGDVEVPKSTAGGRCEITTSTGDIEITVN